MRWLWISTPASWDASRKTIKVDSIEPLSRVTSLEFLTLMGVEPRDARLQPLARITRLKQLAFSHVFSVPMEEYAKLAAALPTTRGNCLHATFAPSVRMVCPKCKEADLVCLTAPQPRTKAHLCPRCDAPKPAAHRAEFTRLKEAR